jgi:hypothetical protein
MKLQSLLLLLVSTLLLITSVWNLELMLQLAKNTKSYSTDEEFSLKCHLSKNTVSVNKIATLGVLILSVFLLVYSIINLTQR